MKPVSRVIYQFWTGDNEMSPARKACLESSVNLGVPVKLITPDNLGEYVIPGHPLHKSYGLLSYTHRSDYLRCYFMHFHGGGYADIKFYTKDNNWPAAFDILDSRPEVDIVGAPEIRGWAAVPRYNQESICSKLVGCGFFVARPMSRFTSLWFSNVESYLTSMSRMLERSAAGLCGYPLPYWGVLGYQIHEACLEIADSYPNSISRELVHGIDAGVPYR